MLLAMGAGSAFLGFSMGKNHAERPQTGLEQINCPLLQPEEPLKVWRVQKGIGGYESSGFVEVCRDSLLIDGEGNTPQTAVDDMNEKLACLGFSGEFQLCEECE